MKYLVITACLLSAGCANETPKPAVEADQPNAMAICDGMQAALKAYSEALQERKITPSETIRWRQLRDSADDACISAYLTGPLDSNQVCADIQRSLALNTYRRNAAPQWPAFREIVRRQQAALEACQTGA